MAVDVADIGGDEFDPRPALGQSGDGGVAIAVALDVVDRRIEARLGEGQGRGPADTPRAPVISATLRSPKRPPPAVADPSRDIDPPAPRGLRNRLHEKRRAVNRRWRCRQAGLA